MYLLFHIRHIYLIYLNIYQPSEIPTTRVSKLGRQRRILISSSNGLLQTVAGTKRGVGSGKDGKLYLVIRQCQSQACITSTL